jgi:hypothetical protein
VNVRLFFVKDRMAAGEIEIQYCHTDQMIGFFQKPCKVRTSFLSKSSHGGTGHVTLKRSVLALEILWLRKDRGPDGIWGLDLER